MSTEKPIRHPDLLREIERFCSEAGMAPSMFGREAVGDGSLVADLNAGRELRSATIERIRGFMDARSRGAAA